MDMYPTYESAKIKHPECDIYEQNCKPMGKLFTPGLMHSVMDGSYNNKCNPADHCMTVEKFLADGYELRENDLILNSVGSVICMDYPNSLDDFGVLNICSKKEYILRAAALETKEPKRTKKVYEKVGCDWAVWEFLKAYSELPDDEQWFIKVSGDQYAPIHDWFVVTETLRAHNLVYQRIETPIEWWEDASEFVTGGSLGHFSMIEDRMLIESAMTRDQWCDFARILLEQGE